MSRIWMDGRKKDITSSMSKSVTLGQHTIKGQGPRTRSFRRQFIMIGPVGGKTSPSEMWTLCCQYFVSTILERFWNLEMTQLRVVCFSG